MARMGSVMLWPGWAGCWVTLDLRLDLGSDMARMGWVLGNAGSGVLIWPGWVGCWVMARMGWVLGYGLDVG